MMLKMNGMFKLGSKMAVLVVLLLCIQQTNAQIVDGFELGSSKIKTIQLRAAHRLNGPMPITVDHGQENKGYNKSQLIENNKGEALQFNSIAHALQQFEDMGWRREDSFVVKEGDTSFICFILARGIR